MSKISQKLLQKQALAALTVLLLVALVPRPGSAQQTSQAEALEVLERTEEYLQQVNTLILEQESDQSRQIFRSAVQKQVQARNFYQRNRYAMAVRMSQTARQVGAQAERIARGSRGFGERAQQAQERFQDLYEQVQDRAMETQNTQAMTFVRQAESLAQRAGQQYQQTRFEQSFELFRQAESSLRRAARLVLAAGDADRLAENQERIAGQLASARDRLGDDADPSLSRALDQAEQTLADAVLAMNSDQPLRALRLTRRASTEVQRVLRQVGGGLNAAAIQREIDRFDARQQELTESAAGSDALDFLQQASGLRDQAASALQRGEKELALRSIRSALNMQRQAGERLR